MSKWIQRWLAGGTEGARVHRNPPRADKCPICGGNRAECMAQAWEAALDERERDEQEGTQGMSTETMEVTDKNLAEFLEKIGFSNYCCGCSNDSAYEISKPFTAVIKSDSIEGEEA
jgi:hypothetical protein